MMLDVTRLSDKESAAIRRIAATMRTEAGALGAGDLAACLTAAAVALERDAGSVSLATLDPV